MISPFKIGDKIRCINPDPERKLRRGKAYIVIELNGLVRVEGLHPYFWETRFEKVSANPRK